jgi:DNA-binding transcriptional ArsR family regulator
MQHLVRNALINILGSTPAAVLEKICPILMRVVESSPDGDILFYLFGLRLGEKLGRELKEIAKEDPWSVLSEIFKLLKFTKDIEILKKEPKKTLICIKFHKYPEKVINCNLVRGIVTGFISQFTGDLLYTRYLCSCLAHEDSCLLELTKISEDSLTNPIRRTIVEYLRVNPGAHMRQMARDLGVSLGSLRWHLSILERRNLVKERKKGNMIEFYLLESIHQR